MREFGVLAVEGEDVVLGDRAPVDIAGRATLVQRSMRANSPSMRGR